MTSYERVVHLVAIPVRCLQTTVVGKEGFNVSIPVLVHGGSQTAHTTSNTQELTVYIL